MVALLDRLGGFIWGEFLLIPLLAFTGLFLTVGLRAMPWTHLGHGVRLLWQGRHSQGAGDILPFRALMTAMSATIGTGNIAGVATAIYLGGPGAIFWMWVIALFGMATKYAEALLAVKYREIDSLGHYVGGPMYYIKNGLGRHWIWLGQLFALFGMLAAFGIGNMVQSNSVANVMYSQFELPTWLSGLLLALFVGGVLVGGIKRIADVATALVPFMAMIYFIGAASIILIHIGSLPGIVRLIVTDAFTGTAASGGFAGASVWMALRFGVARGIFSNEAGLGSAPIAHAAARTKSPVQQGMIAMLETFIDTLVICSMTALVILLSNSWTSGLEGASMTAAAFDRGIGNLGGYVVGLSLVLFSFSTILGWSYYGERCAAFLFGTGIVFPYRLCWIVAIMLGAVIKLTVVWSLADVLNGLMALPNLIALLMLSPVVFSVTRAYLQQQRV